MRCSCQWNSDTAMKVIYFSRAEAPQAEHIIGFKTITRIRSISAINQLFALAERIHRLGDAVGTFIAERPRTPPQPALAASLPRRCSASLSGARFDDPGELKRETALPRPFATWARLKIFLSRICQWHTTLPLVRSKSSESRSSAALLRGEDAGTNLLKAFTAERRRNI
jgi:hypothetical protein